MLLPLRQARLCAGMCCLCIVAGRAGPGQAWPSPRVRGVLVVGVWSVAAHGICGVSGPLRRGAGGHRTRRRAGRRARPRPRCQWWRGRRPRSAALAGPLLAAPRAAGMGGRLYLCLRHGGSEALQTPHKMFRRAPCARRFWSAWPLAAPLWMRFAGGRHAASAAALGWGMAGRTGLLTGRLGGFGCVFAGRGFEEQCLRTAALPRVACPCGAAAPRDCPLLPSLGVARRGPHPMPAIL
ncbi:MAG: hypothetical protein J3K34DRAFT_27856 [Monoraphidium minutum]|nr:MAG: hypothetical protein J3K34DRAFT_27856 [Monoraphidium minutum]